MQLFDWGCQHVFVPLILYMSFHSPTQVQVLGEVFRRMNRSREYPSRLMTADLTALPDCMQPGIMRLQEPSDAFPPAGLFKEGRYYALRGIEGNLVNVRPHHLDPAKRTLKLIEETFMSAEEGGYPRTMATKHHRACASSIDAPADETSEGSRAPLA